MIVKTKILVLMTLRCCCFASSRLHIPCERKYFHKPNANTKIEIA